MKIGIDISQTQYGGGVGRLTTELVTHLLSQNSSHTFVLFFSSLRGTIPQEIKDLEKQSNVILKQVKFPPTFLDFLWNVLHVFPIDLLIGSVDVFISSDWVQPPTRAKKVSIIHDLSVMLYPEEARNESGFSFKQFLFKPNIVAVQKRRLSWVKKEADHIIAVSEATKKDIMHLLSIPESKISVIYEGVR